LRGKKNLLVEKKALKNNISERKKFFSSFASLRLCVEKKSFGVKKKALKKILWWKKKATRRQLL
jgi:hypothetical protein